MKNMFAASLLTVFALNSVSAFAAEALKFSSARVFLPLKGTNTTAGYAEIENTTATEIELKIVSAVPFKAVELHETREKEGRMSMQKKDFFKIAAKSKFELKPGANHVMLFDATKALKAGEKVELVFLVAGKEVRVPFEVVPRVANAHH